MRITQEQEKGKEFVHARDGRMTSKAPRTVFANVFLESSAAPNPFIGATVERFGKVVSHVITEASKVADKVVVKADETVDGVVNKVGGGIKTLIQDIDKILNGLVATLGEVIQAAAALGGEIGKNLKEALNNVQSPFKKLIELYEKNLKAVAEGADGTLKELESLIKIEDAKLKAAVAAVIEILDKISEKPGNDVALVVDTVKDILAKVKDTAEAILSKVAETLKSTENVDDAKKLDDKTFAEYVENEIKTCNEALAAIKKNVEESLATATDEQKINLATVVDFLKDWVPMVNGIQEELSEAVKVNDRENLEKLIEKILEAIENTKVLVNELTKTQVDEIKETLEKNILEFMVGKAVKLVKELKKYLGIDNNSV